MKDRDLTAALQSRPEEGQTVKETDIRREVTGDRPAGIESDARLGKAMTTVLRNVGEEPTTGFTPAALEPAGVSEKVKEITEWLAANFGSGCWAIDEVKELESALATLQAELRTRDVEVHELCTELRGCAEKVQQYEANGAGRVKVLNEKADALRLEWIRAENAEAEIASLRAERDALKEKLEQSDRDCTGAKADATRHWLHRQEIDALLASARPYLQQVVKEMQTISMVAGQCSIDGPPSTMSAMAGAESERCRKWAEGLSALLERMPPTEKSDA